MIQQLKERWKGYKEKRFLEAHGCKHGCKTWRQYERRYDSDVSYMARSAHTYYHGYSHLFPLDPQGLRNYGFTGIHPYHDLCEKMMEWCEQNCQGKWRNDWHCGFWDQHGNFEFNGIGGGDIMFFAFKEESDYIWFRLTWE